MLHPEPPWQFAGHQGYTNENSAPLQLGRVDISGYTSRPVFSGVVKRVKLEPEVTQFPTDGPNDRQLAFAQAIIGYTPQLKHADGSTLLAMESWPVEQGHYDPQLPDSEQIGLFSQVGFGLQVYVVQPANPLIPQGWMTLGGPRVTGTDWYTRIEQATEDDTAYLHLATVGVGGKPMEPWPPDESVYATHSFTWVQPFGEGVALIQVNGDSPDTWYAGAPASEHTSFACNIWEVVYVGPPDLPPTPQPIPAASSGQGVVRRYPVPREKRFRAL